jgi:hypothetical protein
MQKSTIERLFNVVIVVVGCASKEKAFSFVFGGVFVKTKKLDKNLFPSIMKSK